VQIGQDIADVDADAHVEERTTTMCAAIFDDGERLDRGMHQQIRDLVQVGGD
jgi:hypothetical protein